MNRVQQAILPSALICCLGLWIFTRLFSSSFSALEDRQKGILPEPAACSLASVYPAEIQQWCRLIEASATKYDIDPNLVAAVMLQESGGNPNAYSHSGAVGLMQVMPRDGIATNFMCHNGPCFANRPSMEELFDPQFNIDYGVRLLSNLIQKRGSVREGLKAYGPMDVGYRYADIVLNIYENYR